MRYAFEYCPFRLWLTPDGSLDLESRRLSLMNAEGPSGYWQVLVDDNPVIRFVCRECKARWHQALCCRWFERTQGVIAGFDGVPVKFCFNLEASLATKS